MAKDLMGYTLMTREAMRGVVRDALRRAADDGLPGAHHFYITFATSAPGVDVAPELAEAHPDEMTIVLEHQYWDLAVDPDAFEVTLKFGGVPKYLRVPFAALVQFHDPSVEFTLRFEPGPFPEPGASAPRDEDADPPGEASTGDVVSLDAFRKKTD